MGDHSTAKSTEALTEPRRSENHDAGSSEEVIDRWVCNLEVDAPAENILHFSS